MEEIISNYGQCKSFVNMYFESALFRFKKDEFIGKLLGILIYDEKMGCKHEKSGRKDREKAGFLSAVKMTAGAS